MQGKKYFVYIVTNLTHSVLYTGVTSDLVKRVNQHKHKLLPGFTSQYRVDRLVYFEGFDNPEFAIGREKQIKGGSRRKKIALIEAVNPEWEDLTDKL
ncbi:MAG: GIY-YIG nuclease family protein [Candidatus Zixiibacteriota bacterium]|nr:MAG: GIY-YIG nuclease family protein [candidate division Zixibacteria bacterium]